MDWEKKDIAPELVKNMTARYGCDRLTASILARRNITEGEDILYYLENDPRHLRNPFDLPNMEDAVDRILAAKEEGEKILIFGDRDVDGITSASMLTSFLTRAGMDVSWRIPMGDESYGLSIEAVEEFAAEGGTLIITVDCGISNVAETARAAELGIDVVVTDHHTPPEKLPGALALVNPKLPGSRYPFKHLAGCGVAYKLTAALRFALKSGIYGQPICLLNVQPVNDAYVIEIAKMRNLSVVDKISETVIPGMLRISETRLPAFLEGQHIISWDAPLQQKMLAKIFGGGFEIQMLDLAPEIGKEIKQTEGKSLLRIRELSKIARYTSSALGELEVFINLFTSFIQRKEKLFTDEDMTDLQLAALGTIADIMPLTDENRVIVRYGLASLIAKPRPGLSDLLFKLDLAGKRIGTKEIAWQLGPVINASGRMGSPDKAVRLLLSADPEERNRLTGEILLMNEERKKLVNETWAKVEPQAAESLETYGGKLVMVSGEGIYRGITGLIASRLGDRFRVPSAVISFGEDHATGSLRSAGGYNVLAVLEQCGDLFIDKGGHPYAAGFSMDRAHWDEFRERLKYTAAAIELGPGEDAVKVDAELPRSYLTPDIFKVVDLFEPYGQENSPLTFLTRGIKIQDISLMGKPDSVHVKLTLDAGKYKWPAVYWRAVEKVKRDFDINDRVDLVFTVCRDWFNGIETPQIIVTDLKRSAE
ncbi:MAG: single-stranded-DNA-specific exonuclease RecJ [Treponema sp.]|jgi:single-stranded-DNA-specific exonuclease|nr:single-stranded-DNA-specific exonuclease RecJ [Treponema sp.]